MPNPPSAPCADDREPAEARTAAPLHVLIVEDSEVDCSLLIRVLRQAGMALEGERVEDEDGMRAALGRRPWDAVISDHVLPCFSSTRALEVFKSFGLDVPFLIVSGEIGEDIAVEAMLAGADDYILKSRLARLAPALQRSLRAAEARRRRREAEEALKRSHEQLRALSAHLERVKEDERRAISREIHDDIGGILTSLKFELAWLRARLASDPEVVPRLDTMTELLDAAVQASQRVVRNLRPSILDLDIVAALEWQARDFSRRHGVPCRFQTNRETLDLADEQRTALFRICQEALTNIAKHAGAKSVAIDLFEHDGRITLEVADDGAGIRPLDLEREDRFGLRGMRERTAALGGWLEVDGAPGRGTVLMVGLPRSLPG